MRIEGIPVVTGGHPHREDGSCIVVNGVWSIDVDTAIAELHAVVDALSGYVTGHAHRSAGLSLILSVGEPVLLTIAAMVDNDLGFAISVAKDTVGRDCCELHQDATAVLQAWVDSCAVDSTDHWFEQRVILCGPVPADEVRDVVEDWVRLAADANGGHANLLQLQGFVADGDTEHDVDVNELRLTRLDMWRPELAHWSLFGEVA